MISGLILGSVFFLFAFFLSIFTIYLCFKVVMKMTRYDDVKLILANNTAAAIVISASFVAVAIMVKNALYPINAVFQDFWFLADKGAMHLLDLLSRAAGYLTLTVALSLASVSAALRVFQRLTRDIDEEHEIIQNNIAVGLLLGGVLVAFAILIESGIGNFVNALIPIQDLMNR